MQLLDWQNLIFLAPIGLGALYLLLMAVGLAGSEHGGEADVGMDHDVGIDAGHDIGLDHGAEVDLAHDVGLDASHDVGLDAGHDVPAGDLAHAGADAGHAADLHAGPGPLLAVAQFLGVGRVPLAILGLSYCFVWGATGLAVLALVGRPEVWTAIGAAALAAVLVTRFVAAGVGRLVPSVETHYTPPRVLVGLHGEVLYEVTESSGTVRVRDPQDNLRDVSSRVAPGAPVIPAGRRVVLLRYDAAARVFVVEP